jgi:hypothetical protein
MKRRLYAAALLGGVAMLAVLAVVVLRFGRFDPSPPSLEDHPNPAIPGELAWVDNDACIVRAAASGATREQVYCGGRQGGLGQPTWIDATHVGVLQYSGAPGPELIEIDLETGKTTSTGKHVTIDSRGPAALTSPDGETLSVDEDGTLFRIKDGQRTRIADFDVARYQQPQPMSWSPDGQWILLSYYPRRSHGSELWIVSRDGATKGTIATDVMFPNASWRVDGVGVTPELLAE